MEFGVRHVTRFRYSAPISESVMEVRMQPRRDAGQHCLSFELSTEPSTRVTATRDYMGNIVHHFDLPEPHRALTITAQALVSVTRQPPTTRLDAAAWERLDALTADGDYVELLIPSEFARPTAPLEALAAELGVARRADPLTSLREINHGLHRALSYQPDSTRVDSPIDDALRMRQGVCQDFAHIMIALVRGLGVPCRYVSGYLYRPTGAAGGEIVRGADATHAWVEALLPELGWVGFDPTNDVLVGDGHIAVALGRDYADVPPTRGVFKGRASTELGVAVQVMQADERFRDDELLLVMRRDARPDEPHAADVGEQPQQ